jgi:hypothetical protein
MLETNMGCLESVALSIGWILPFDLDIHGDARTELSTAMNNTVCFDSPVLTSLLDPARSSEIRPSIVRGINRMDGDKD